jgi:hypothetical protein
MAATKTVSQLSQFHNSSAELIVPRHGVITLFGYGCDLYLAIKEHNATHGMKPKT